MPLSTYVPSLTGLVIYTSALFALSKHFSDHQVETIEVLKERLGKIELKDRQDNPSLQEVKKKWDVARLKKPIRLDTQIAILFIILAINPVVHFCLIICPKPDSWAFIIIGILYLALSIMSAAWLPWSYSSMKKERRDFKTEVENIEIQYNLVITAINNR